MAISENLFGVSTGILVYFLMRWGWGPASSTVPETASTPVVITQPQETRPYFMLRFKASKDDPTVIHSAHATLVRPDGTVRDISGENREPTALFLERLDKQLKMDKEIWSDVEGIIIEDFESPSGISTITQKLRRMIETALRPYFFVRNFDWRKTRSMPPLTPLAHNLPTRNIDELIGIMALDPTQPNSIPSDWQERMQSILVQDRAARQPDYLWLRSALWVIKSLMDQEGYAYDRPGRYELAFGPAPSYIVVTKVEQQLKISDYRLP